jgi:CheY-like chemotaxis protein
MTSTNLNILIVDDDNDDVELIRESISDVEKDVSFLTAENGLNSLELLNSLPENQLPDLIILDHNMPKLTGSEVLLLLCNNDRYLKIPKIIFTTSSSAALIKECSANGATDYYIKPSVVDEYRQFARQVINFCRNVTPGKV